MRSGLKNTFRNHIAQWTPWPLNSHCPYKIQLPKLYMKRKWKTSENSKNFDNFQLTATFYVYKWICKNISILIHYTTYFLPSGLSCWRGYCRCLCLFICPSICLSAFLKEDREQLIVKSCVSNITIIGSDNGLLPGRRQAIIWSNAGIFLIRTVGTNFCEILSKIHAFSLKKIHFKMSSAKWWQVWLGLNVLTGNTWAHHSLK